MVDYLNIFTVVSPEDSLVDEAIAGLANPPVSGPVTSEAGLASSVPLRTKLILDEGYLSV